MSVDDTKKEMDDWFFLILKNLKINNSHRFYIDYKNKKGDLIILNHKNGKFFISYDLIWSVFEKKYEMKYIQIQEYTKAMLIKHLDKEVTKTFLWI